MTDYLVWWFMPIVSIFRRLKQEDYYEFEARLGYIVSSRPDSYETLSEKIRKIDNVNCLC